MCPQVNNEHLRDAVL